MIEKSKYYYIRYSGLLVFLVCNFLLYLIDDPSLLGFRMDYYNFISPSIKLFAENSLEYATKNYPAAMNPFYFIVFANIGKLLGTQLVILRSVNVVLTFLTFLILFKVFKLVFSNRILAFCLIIPFLFSFNLRGSTIWLNTDGLPLLLISGSILIYQYTIKVKLSYKTNYLAIFAIYSLAFLAFYTRQFYVWYIFYIVVQCIKCFNTKRFIFFQIVLLLLLAIPQFMIFKVWNGFVNPNFKHHLVTGIDYTSISIGNAYFIFFMIPFLFLIDYSKIQINIFSDNKFKYYALISILCSVLLCVMFDLNRLSVSGGGLLIRFLYLLSKNNICYIFIFAFNFAYLMFLYVLYVSKSTWYEIITVVMFVALFYTTVVIMPKYYDPIVYFVLFILFKKFISVNKSVIPGATALILFQFINYILLMSWIKFFK